MEGRRQEVLTQGSLEFTGPPDQPIREPLVQEETLSEKLRWRVIRKNIQGQLPVSYIQIHTNMHMHPYVHVHIDTNMSTHILGIHACTYIFIQVKAES